MAGKIVVRGAREHNLKNIDLEIPRDRLVVITGVSGSGKSSLAFDTLYAEGQRRYVESLSAYARQFLEQMERPDVDSIEGLSPAISIEQAAVGHSPRSTVGTVTEVYDHLRLLYARVGTVECYQCGGEIAAQTIQQVVDRLLALPRQTALHILAPVAAGRRGEFRRELGDLARAGFARVKIDGEPRDLGEEIALEKNRPHDIDLVVDRLTLREGVERRLADSLEVASRYGDEVVKVELLRDGESEGGETLVFSQKHACARCGISYPELTPRLFSFNSPQGACPACGGLGSEADGERSPAAGAPCRRCRGARLRRESLHVKIGGKSIAELAAMAVGQSSEFFSGLCFDGQAKVVADKILPEISSRLSFMAEVGLDYLTLDRPAATLSSGEAQRIRLATQIGSSLVGVLYILDEPSIGLHARDNARLLAILRRLRDLGNTVLVVEHDRETILEADHVIDMGPGAGRSGGELVAQGAPLEIMEKENSLTGRYLAGRMEIPVPSERRRGSGKKLVLTGARRNNLKGVTLEIPIGAITCVTGVSGSGKSSLVVDTLCPALARRLSCPGKEKERERSYQEIHGWEHLTKMIVIDQAPIGRTPRSNPATYSGLFDSIRELFARLPEARVRGYGPGRFSFNRKGGRCEACEGDGVRRIEMHFLPDVYVTCDLCGGKRYNRESLEILYKGRTIADVLDLAVSQVLELMGNIPAIREKLETLMSVGLGYLHLGQAAPTLSGGEAQRIKLARELSKRSSGRTLYVLDEPTTGLHFDDIKKLLEVLNRLTDAGNTVLIIEHNLDVIKSADHIVDLGPEGGDGGGEIIAQGSPEELSLAAHSYTGQFVKRILAIKKV